MLFAPNPEVIVIGLVPPKVSAGEVRVAIEVGVYDAPVQEDIRTRYDCLKGFVHGIRVPNGKSHSGAAILGGRFLVQFRRHQQRTEFSACVDQEGVVGIVYGLLRQQLLGGFGRLCGRFDA